LHFALRPTTPADRALVERLIAARWGASTVAAHGRLYRPAELAGFLALDGSEAVGLVTYDVAGGACEIVSIDSLRPGEGIGSALLRAVEEQARRLGCRRLWLITTNDNLDAIRFYGRRRFRQVAVHRDAVAAARRLKPEIPLIGANGIPIRDEIEMAKALD
jgi:GNAT superfamily N-acetyltransferase